MKSILLDELTLGEINSIRAYLNQNAILSNLEDLYWLTLEPELWNETQKKAAAQKNSGGGYRFSVEINDGGWVKFELLVRAVDGMDNLGGGPADDRQAVYLLNWAAQMSKELKLDVCL